MGRTVFDSLDANTARMAVEQEILVDQMSDLLGISKRQLAVQGASLRVQLQLSEIASRQNEVGKEQLVAALRVAKTLDVTNKALGRIESSLGDLSGLLVQQNALLQKSLRKLAAEAQEHIERGMEAYNHGWYQDSRRDFEAAVVKDPYSAIAYYFLARCHHLEGNEEEADRTYDKCLVYSQASSPVFRSLALCDLAKRAAASSDVSAARKLLALAAVSPDADVVAVAAAAVTVDCAAAAVDEGTHRSVVSALEKEHVDPEVLIEILRKQIPAQAKGTFRKELDKAFMSWEGLARDALYDRLLSHFYREVSDFAYLAPRVRASFLNAAHGRFHALIAPLADLLEWTAATCDHIAANVAVFPRSCPDVLRLYRCLGEWNATLVRLNTLASRLAGQEELTNKSFVGQLNLGLVELPYMYEDDRILFEVSTVEGDLLALTCYYAIFTRNGQEHFNVALHDFGLLAFDSYPHGSEYKGVAVRDSRTGQTLLQGTTPGFRYQADAQQMLHFYLDVFISSGRLLSGIHECLQWAATHEDELFSVCLLLNAIVERQTRLASRPATRVSGMKKAIGVGDEPEVVADEPEVVEDEPDTVGEEPEIIE